MGYIRYSRSVNSQRSIDDFEVPKSHITKALIDQFLNSDKFLDYVREELKRGTPTNIEMLDKVPVKKWKDATLEAPYISHHTSKYYNYTPHYDLLRLAEIVHESQLRESGLSVFEDGLFECKNGKGDFIYRCTLKNGSLDGFLEWYENGQLKELSHYNDGLLDGLYEEWYENGQLEIRAAYKDNKLEGLAESWHKNGQLSGRVHYKDGWREGIHEKWYPNGQPRWRENYKDGLLDGLSEKWYDDGQLEERISYKGGRYDGLSEKWYPNGQLRERSNYKAGNYDGLREKWYENGQLEERISYKGGRYDGLKEKWYANGKLKSRQNFSHDRLDGLYEKWDYRVELVDQRIFRNGQLISQEYIPEFSDQEKIETWHESQMPVQEIKLSSQNNNKKKGRRI